jgi:hypothetical protein
MRTEPLFVLCQPLGQVFMRGEEFAQVNERAHHMDGNLCRTRTAEDRGGHDGAVLGEGEWRILAVPAAPRL